jgi:hypothetical protein
MDTYQNKMLLPFLIHSQHSHTFAGIKYSLVSQANDLNNLYRLEPGSELTLEEYEEVKHQTIDFSPNSFAYQLANAGLY